LLGGIPGFTRQREFSEGTALRIDQAVRAFVDHAFEHATEILTTRRAVLDAGAQALLAKETLSEEELAAPPATATAEVATG
jgi:cell division protease FtsH